MHRLTCNISHLLSPNYYLLSGRYTTHVSLSSPNRHPITLSSSHGERVRERGRTAAEGGGGGIGEMAWDAAEVEGRSYWGMTGRECDSCRSTPATLFCRADSAFLCSACDSRVHSANKLASRHERVWLCEVCEQSPAAVTCKADAAALCLACDADIHSANPLARRHDRVPIVPITSSSPTPPLPLHHQHDEDGQRQPQDNNSNDDVASWLLPNPNNNNNKNSTTTINNNSKGSSDALFFADAADPYADLDYAFHVPEASPYDFDVAKAKPPPSSLYAPSLSHSVSSSEVGVVPDGGGMGEISNACVTGVPVNPAAVAAVTAGVDREARVMRYREKRKNRKFEKTIRYASRKAYAETRPRVKGRFAKRTKPEPEPRIGDGINTVAADTGYGVVPSFWNLSASRPRAL